MLIINADDLGHDRVSSDAICDVFSRGSITSATAMVFMEDSPRAFSLAAEVGIPIGLHLNLMEAYTGEVPSAEGRAEQAWVVNRFRSSFVSRWAPTPKLMGSARRCVSAQLSEFERLHGGHPTHVDGHQHGHLSTPALWELGWSDVRRVRSSFTFRHGEKPSWKRALRSGLNRGISRRFVSTRRFHSIRDLHPTLGGDGIEQVVAEAAHLDIEVMCHPALADEFGVLTSEDWQTLIVSVPRGSFADLP